MDSYVNISDNIEFLKETPINIDAVGTGALSPTLITVGVVKCQQFAINDEIYISSMIEEDYSSGDLVIGLQIVAMGNQAGKKTRWWLNYRTWSDGDTINTTTAQIYSADTPLLQPQYTTNYVFFTIPFSLATKKEHLSMLVKRVATSDGSDPATNPAIAVSELYYIAKVIP